VLKFNRSLRNIVALRLTISLSLPAGVIAQRAKESFFMVMQIGHAFLADLKKLFQARGCGTLMYTLRMA
jgi:hypothetical protein